MALSSDGAWLARADPAQPVSTRVISVAALSGSQGLDASECSKLVAEPLPVQGQATAVAWDDAGFLYVQSREPAMLERFRVDPSGGAGSTLLMSFSLSATAAQNAGQALFHRDLGSGLSCASCHGEALDDGHVWSFAGHGLRRTKSLRGGVGQRGPLGWEGAFAGLDAFVVEEVQRLRGVALSDAGVEFSDAGSGGAAAGAAPSSSDMHALATWLDGLPALSIPARQVDAGIKGKQLFESTALGCADCHTGPQLTNRLTRDVGTGGAFEVPSLLGLGLRPPYMHDGCAQQLQDGFNAGCGGAVHARALQLGPDELSALLAYLMGL
jgi:hypothetical protein